MKTEEREIVEIVTKHFAEVQAIYLFGSFASADDGPDSDVDLALLLSHQRAKTVGNLFLHPVHAELERSLNRDVDLVNLRCVSTVMQKEVIMADRRICCADQYAADEFEMLTISFYQKLNEERADIIEEALKSGKFHNL